MDYFACIIYMVLRTLIVVEVTTNSNVEAYFNLQCVMNGGCTTKRATICDTVPCYNQATCTDVNEAFYCTCAYGWAGQICDEDIQPPVFDICPTDIRLNATERTLFVSWSEPTFTDPMGTELLIVSNFKTPGFTFPWGDFTVQYSATKLKNGMQTECVFMISLRPTPCNPLPLPAHGAILCNDWSSDYGQFCLLICNRTYAPSPPGRLGAWMICGDDGKWSSLPTDCSLHMKNDRNLLAYHKNYDEFVYDNCSDNVRLRELFLTAMQKHSYISEFCRLYKGCDDISSVRVFCN